MRTLTALSGLAGLAFALLAGSAAAVVHTGTLNGDEAQATTCAVGSTSQIIGTWSYDDVSGLFSWSYTYGDNAPSFDDGVLFGTGTPTVAHFHGPAAAGVGAGVRVGTVETTPNVNSTTISAAFGTELLDELWYINVHSTNCTGGELRGQLLLDAAPSVPVLSQPVAWLLVIALIGFGTVLLTRREPARG